MLRPGAPGLLLCLLCGFYSVQAAEPLRVGALQFGTVNWRLQVIQAQGLAAAHGVDLEIVPLASPGAGSVTLQGGGADMIVSDWLYVARQRGSGQGLRFAPYSLAVGDLMVHPDAGITSLADLADKRLGVAGGPLDKSWLLLQAYARETLNMDLATAVEPNFAAPPLLNELMLSGELPAVVNYWHFAARLQGAGMQPLIGVAEILPALGVETPVPLLGWVFHSDWAEAHRETVEGFLQADREAAELMRDDDALWDELRPLMKAEDEATFEALKAAYRAGIPGEFGDAERQAAAQVYGILAEIGGPELVGEADRLPDGTFWP